MAPKYRPKRSTLASTPSLSSHASDEEEDEDALEPPPALVEDASGPPLIAAAPAPEHAVVPAVAPVPVLQAPSELTQVLAALAAQAQQMVESLSRPRSNLKRPQPRLSPKPMLTKLMSVPWRPTTRLRRPVFSPWETSLSLPPHSSPKK